MSAVLTVGAWYFTGNPLDDGGWAHGLAGNIALQLRLVARGHTHIGYVTAAEPAARQFNALRTRFAREAARRIGLDDLAEISISPPLHDGAPSLRQALDRDPRITALATTDDHLALALLRAMHVLGLSAPVDVAVIGFGASRVSALSVPSLSTIQVDAETHGRLAARDILELDTSGLTPAPGRVIERESSATSRARP